jgi:tRNA-modifying protein YgfZ
MHPRDDESFANEYDALAGGCGFYPLTNWTVVTLLGADRQNFLHNMCTNDLRTLSSGEGCESFCTDVKGKIVAHLYVLLREDHLVLVTVPGQAERIISHLDRYIIREDVQLADESHAQAWTVLAGPRSPAVLGGPPITLERPWQNATCVLGGLVCVLVRFALPGREAYLVGISRGQDAELRRVLCEAGATACGEEAWNSLRVESGLPLFGVDFDHSHLPQEVARNAQAISFTKGCYLGQETIARIDALGHVNKQLATLKFAESAWPTPGTTLTHHGQSAGAATTVGWSNRLGAALALGMVRRDGNAIGTMLESSCGPAEVVDTPAVGGDATAC